MKILLQHLPKAALVFALLSATLLVNTGAKGKPPTDTPVTTTIDGLGVDTLPTLRVQSDQLGAYRNSSSLSSIIQGIGDWELDMVNFNSSPQRKVLIDLRDPVPGSGPNGGAPVNPFGSTGYQIVRGRFISKCSQNGINFLNMQPNNIYPCPLALAFDDANGVKYRLAENPVNFSETNWLQVTCITTGTNGKCNQWKIEPSVTQLNGELKNVAKLLKVATKPHDSDQDMGDFYLSFTIHVTNP
jgi:hypothetical protein